MQQAVSNGAATAIVEWNDAAGGPEELVLCFVAMVPDARDLRITLPGGRVRFCDAGLTPDVTSEGPLHWRIPFNAARGPNRIVFELTGELSPGCDFDMPAVRASLRGADLPPVSPCVVQWELRNFFAELIDRGEVRHDAPSDGVVYDLGIPWELMGAFRPRPGTRVGYDVRIHDCDSAGSGSEDWTQRGWLGWPPRMDPNLYDPSGFGTLEFRP